MTPPPRRSLATARGFSWVGFVVLQEHLVRFDHAPTGAVRVLLAGGWKCDPDGRGGPAADPDAGKPYSEIAFGGLMAAAFLVLFGIVTLVPLAPHKARATADEPAPGPFRVHGP